MKRLIEKGIGAILLCLQIIMAAATACSLIGKVAVVVLLACGVAYQEEGVFAVLITLAALAISIISVPTIGAFLSAFLSGVIQAMFSHLSKRNERLNFYYGYKKAGKVDEVLAKDFGRLTDVFDVRGFLHGEAYGCKMSLKSKCIFLSPMEYLLRCAGLSISLYRDSSENIEKDYSNAIAEMGFYRTNGVDVQSKFMASREEREHRCEEASTCKGYCVDCIIGLFRTPYVRYKHIVHDLLSWMIHRMLIILYTVYFIASACYVLRCETGDRPFLLAAHIGIELGAVGFMAYMFFECKNLFGMLAFCRTVSKEYEECEEHNQLSYKKSAFDFVDYLTVQWYYAFGHGIHIQYNILDIFQAFLDLHKEGWRMKIFPFSAERVRQEKADAAARGEEIVIFPDVDEIEARLAEEERKEQRIASIGEL